MDKKINNLKIMPRKYDYLTKSKITSGLQCHKKLWFDIHEPTKKIEKAVFKMGNRFGEQVIKNYSKDNLKILNLTGVWANPVERTLNAIKSKNIDIYHLTSSVLQEDTPSPWAIAHQFGPSHLGLYFRDR